MHKEVRAYAKAKHAEVNHRYGDEDYVYHLDSTFNAMIDIIDCVLEQGIDISAFHVKVLHASAFTHDLIEDCRVSYNDLIQDLMECCGLDNETAVAIAELTFAVTNEKGKSRKDRANDKYYEDMRKVKFAVILKIADRIANFRHSKKTNSSMLIKYKGEMENFIEQMIRNSKCPVADIAVKLLREGVLDV